MEGLFIGGRLRGVSRFVLACVFLRWRRFVCSFVVVFGGKDLCGSVVCCSKGGREEFVVGFVIHVGFSFPVSCHVLHILGDCDKSWVEYGDLSFRGVLA